MWFIDIVIILLWIGFITWWFFLWYVWFIRDQQRKRRYDQSKKLKFLSVKIPKIAAKNSDTIVIETFDETYKHHITLTHNEPVSFVNGYYVIAY